MKKSLLLIISTALFLTSNAQINEHSDRRTSITIGSFNPIIQKPQLQFEHLLGSKGSQHWSIGENLQYHLGLLNQTEIWSGPKVSIFTRYYFKDQSIKHGKDWFLQAKVGAAYLTNPFSDITNVGLVDASGVPVNDPDGNQIEVINNSDFWLTYGGGIAYGYRVVTCKGWTWEAFAGYHYWAGPNYFTTEFKNWIKEDGNDYDDSANLEGRLYDVENGLNQFWLFSYGFPLDLQVKVGKVLNW